MSSIERAIEKLNGTGADAAPAPADEEKQAPEAVAPAADERPGVDAPEEQGGAAAAPAPDIAQPQVEAVEAPAASQHGFAAVPTGQLADDYPGKRFVHIDNERLAAAGHLIPDPSLTTRASEEYQQIKRRLLGNMVEGVLNTTRPKNLIMITSSLPSEGKTFTSVNLALSLTMEVDHTVLVVDTDIVKRDLSRTFAVEHYTGLYDLLADDSLRLEDLLVRTSLPNLVILPAGQNREQATERLASAQMRALTDELATRYSDRVVLFDSPPILATTTAAALAPLVGQLMIVVEAARTKQEIVRDALNRVEGIRVTGMILNKSRQPATRAYDYYGYYYRPE
ncbi:MAG: AAA family ATPase [Gammaproteobacteria bacterium]